MFCGSCGTQIKEGAKFCPNCGWAVPVAPLPVEPVVTEQPKEKQPSVCARCGAVLKEGALFCPNCGQAVEIKSVQPEAVVVEQQQDEIELETSVIEETNDNESDWKDIMSDNGFAEYFEVFEENNINSLDIILELSDSDLEKMGMTKIGDRKKFLKLFREV